MNSLLTILNERIFHNGNQPQHVPLRSLISASNELPSGQEELSALYDRFLMRTFVGPVREEHLHRLFDAPGVAHQPTLQLTAQDFQAVDAAAQQVRIPPEVGEAIRGIWAAHKEAFKEDRREYLSDRRLVKLLKLLRVSAATNHRTEVDLSDAMLLQHCLWNHPDNMDKVREIVITTLKRHSAMVPVSGDAADRVEDAHVVRSDNDPISKLALPPTKTRTKGFMGCGTVQDPIRIGSVEDLISMDDPEIMRVGYHFVQTTDIDCAEITSWPDFPFHGHYNGNGKTIRNLKINRTQKYPIKKISTIFMDILDASSVNNLNLEGVGLTWAISLPTNQMQQQQKVGHWWSHLYVKNQQQQQQPQLTRPPPPSVHISNCRISDSFLVCGSAKAAKIVACEATNGGFVFENSVGNQIIDCQVTNGGLVFGRSTGTHISGCKVSSGSVIKGDAEYTNVSRCEINYGFPLIESSLMNSHISDCIVVVNLKGCGIREFGLIAGVVKQGSIVEKCFIAGDFVENKDGTFFGGIAGLCDSSTIRQCGVGTLNVNLKNMNQRKRIVFTTSLATLQNNASIDTNTGEDDPNGSDGKTIATARFNQRFFEGNLGWDFDTVWQWDTANNRPALRFASQATANATAANGTSLEDLLTRQVQANIWL